MTESWIKFDVKDELTDEGWSDKLLRQGKLEEEDGEKF